MTNEKLADEKLFVINNVGRVDGNGKTTRPSGNIVITVVNSRSDQPQSILVKNTWLPQDLSLQASRDDIERNFQFRDLVNKGNLRIISTEEARAILATPHAVAENDRLTAKEEERSVIHDDGITADILTPSTNQGSPIPNEEESMDIGTGRDASIPPSVSNIIDRPSENYTIPPATIPNDDYTIPTNKNEASTIESPVVEAYSSIPKASTNMAIALLDRYQSGEISQESLLDAIHGLRTILSESDVRETYDHPAASEEIISIVQASTGVQYTGNKTI